MAQIQLPPVLSSMHHGGLKASDWRQELQKLVEALPEGISADSYTKVIRFIEKLLGEEK